MSTWGARPAAWAWTTWARPISPPSGVMKLFRAMFWALKGATRMPSWRKMRHSPATMMLLPTSEPEPRIIKGRYFMSYVSFSYQLSAFSLIPF